MNELAATSYPLLNVFWTMLWFFLWVLFLIILFKIIGDIFRDDELSGGAKAAWTIFVIVLPFLGALVYLIARGKGMGERDVRAARKHEEEFRAYVREASEPSEGNGVKELATLADLRNRGDISEDEYQRAKTKILA